MQDKVNNAAVTLDTAKFENPIKYYTYRLHFTKTGRLIYISHLDLNRTFAKILNRAKLPIYYSEGFNPRPKVNFATPLSLGQGSNYELVDIRLTEEVAPDIIVSLLNQASPEGLEFISAYPPIAKFTDAYWSAYDIVLKTDNRDVISSAIDEMLSKKELIVEKRTKSGIKDVDIAPSVASVSYDKTLQGVTVHAMLSCESKTFLNPDLLIKTIMSFSQDAQLSDTPDILRTAVYCQDKKTLFK